MTKPLSQLSYGGRLAHSVIGYAIFAERCQEMRISEMEELLRPIFGQEALDEARSVYTDKPRNDQYIQET